MSTLTHRQYDRLLMGSPLRRRGVCMVIGAVLLVLPAGATLVMLNEDFAGRILPFGSDAASPYARIAAARRRAGHPISHFDAQIAAIAQSTGAAVATRNVSDLGGCGVKVINPWQG